MKTVLLGMVVGHRLRERPEPH